MEETPPVANVAPPLQWRRPAVSPTNEAVPPPAVPPVRAAPVVLTPQDTEDDMALEYDSMVLLSQLEQFAIRLTDSTMQASHALALEYMVQVVNCLIDFTEKLPMARARKFTLDTLLTRDRKNYARLGTDYVRHGRLVLAIFEQLHIRRGTMRHPNTFQQLTRDLLRIINICLNICVKSFHHPELRQQWRTVYSGFLVNLVRALQKLQTVPSRG